MERFAQYRTVCKVNPNPASSGFPAQPSSLASLSATAGYNGSPPFYTRSLLLQIHRQEDRSELMGLGNVGVRSGIWGSFLRPGVLGWAGPADGPQRCNIRDGVTEHCKAGCGKRRQMLGDLGLAAGMPAGEGASAHPAGNHTWQAPGGSRPSGRAAGRPLALLRAPRGWRVQRPPRQVRSSPLLSFAPAPLLLSFRSQLLPHLPLPPSAPAVSSCLLSPRAGSGASWSAGVGARAQLRRAGRVGSAFSGCWDPERSWRGPGSGLHWSAESWRPFLRGRPIPRRAASSPGSPPTLSAARESGAAGNRAPAPFAGR